MNRLSVSLSVALHAVGIATAIGLSVAGSWPEVQRPARISVRPSEARIAVNPTPDRPTTAEPVTIEPAPPLEAEVHEPEVHEPEPAEFSPDTEQAQPLDRHGAAAASLPQVGSNNQPLRKPEQPLREPEPRAPDPEPQKTPPTPVAESAPSARVEAQALDALNDPPDYPRIALRRGWEGEAVIRLDLDAEGRVRDASLVQSSGHACLDVAALAAVKEWRYEPARNDAGEPVGSQLDVPVEFRLDAHR